MLAIRLIKQAWEEVTITTIKNCFSHCGAVPEVGGGETSNPFEDLDRHQGQLSSLNELVQQIDSGITADQYLEDEEELATCVSFDGVDNCVKE